MLAITGGSGFIGTRLCERLFREHIDFKIIDLAPPDNPLWSCLICDIRDQAGMERALRGCSTVIHLAAAHRDDIRPKHIYDEVNVEGTRSLCAAADAVGVKKIVFTSSVACYGFARPESDESTELLPFNDYGRTKAAAELVLREWQILDPRSRSLVILRPTVVFGERNRGNVYNLLRQIATRKFVMIGDGINKKSMAYVENVAACLVYVSSLGVGVHCHNYIDKPDLSMDELVALARGELGIKGRVARLPYWLGLLLGYGVDLVAALTGKQFSVSAIRVKKFCATTCFSTSIATTGFVPPIDLMEGLKKTIKHEFLGPANAERVFISE